MDESLEVIWRRCRYHVVVPGTGAAELVVGAPAPVVDAALPVGVDTWAYLTAHNPGAQPGSASENRAREQGLDDELARLQRLAWAGEGGRDPHGSDWTPEASRLVLGISLGEAHTLARRFGQLAFLFGARGAPVSLVPVTTSAEELPATRPLDTVAWVRVDDDQHVLMARPRGKPLFFMPGGKKEPGESDIQALVREVREELAVAVEPHTIEALFVVEAPAWGRTDTVVRMACFSARVAGEPVPAAEIEELAWLGVGEGNRMPPAGRLVVERMHRRR